MATVLCIGGEALHTRHPLLKSAGFDVLTATNECASLAIGRLPAIHAVILDTHSAISDLSGLATELKCMRPSLPVVLVSDLGAADAPQPGIVFDRVLFTTGRPRGVARCDPRTDVECCFDLGRLNALRA